ncbi:MAG: DUF111 family protein [Bacteroidales bacterium]|nr:DUF111 family protein [Bacteroidales bacterium]
MEQTLYLECFSGISGDMTAAALLDLGADQNVLCGVLDNLSLQGFRIEISRVMKSGIDACDFNVVLEENDNHDHDMAYLYGHLQGHTHDVPHGHEAAHGHAAGDSHSHGETGHGHAAGDSHSHGETGHEHAAGDSHGHGEMGHSHGHVHPHIHRGIKEIREIIENSSMTEGAKATALNIFTILAEAEAKAHRVPVEEVHFHEVGAVDSIVDIVSVAVCLDNLRITKVVVPELWEGKGTVRCQHGILPIPVPAVANIMQAYHLSVQITEIMGELVTPTGAAIVAAIKTSGKLPEKFTIKKIGLGAGKRKYECPGLLRAMLIEEGSEADR